VYDELIYSKASGKQDSLAARGTVVPGRKSIRDACASCCCYFFGGGFNWCVVILMIVIIIERRGNYGYLPDRHNAGDQSTRKEENIESE
jgi:hypothetical protein